MANTQEPANRKSISSLQEETDYLREENHAKTQIIKQITDMKVAPSNSDITKGTCSYKVPILIASVVTIKNLQLT